MTSRPQAIGARQAPGADRREVASGRTDLVEFPHAAHSELLDRSGFERPADLNRFRAVFPGHWARFLRSHFRSHIEVAAFFEVTERAARNWWEGSCHRPSGHTVALAAAAFPDGFAQMMRRAA